MSPEVTERVGTMLAYKEGPVFVRHPYHAGLIRTIILYKPDSALSKTQGPY